MIIKLYNLLLSQTNEQLIIMKREKVICRMCERGYPWWWRDSEVWKVVTYLKGRQSTSEPKNASVQEGTYMQYTYTVIFTLIINANCDYHVIGPNSPVYHNLAQK